MDEYGNNQYNDQYSEQYIDQNNDQYSDQYNVEDTAQLFTGASQGDRKKRLILLISAAAAVLIVAVIASYFVISDKKYEDQIALANKAFVEGNYAQAEAEFLKAVEMNERKTKAKEGLAYVYALEGKFDDSAKVYQEVYKKTKDEKQKKAIEKAIEDVQNKTVPSNAEVVPAKDIWRSISTEQVGYYGALNHFLWGLEEDYFIDSTEDTFDCNNADGFPALQMMMIGLGAYDVSAEEYTEYAKSIDDDNTDEVYIPERILEWQEGSDPRNWAEDGDMEDEYATADAEKTNILLKEVFNVTDDVIENSLKESESDEIIYLDEGLYYGVDGWKFGDSGVAAEIQEVFTDGNKYCIEYYGGHMDEEGYDENIIDRSEPFETRYALVEPKLIDDEHYWSVYYVGPDMPKEVTEGLAAASEGNVDAAAGELCGKLDGQSFYYSSGVGGWGTELLIHSDGTFSGTSHDSNMGDTGSKYPHGTTYYCEFSGRVTNVKKVSDNEYKLTLTDMKYDDRFTKEDIEEYYEDGVKYVPGEPYGVSVNTEYTVYMPDVNETEVSTSFAEYVTQYYDITFSPTLGVYGLFGKTEYEEASFISYEQ